MLASFPVLQLAVQVLFEPYHLVSARGSIVAKFDEAYCCMHVISRLQLISGHVNAHYDNGW